MKKTTRLYRGSSDPPPQPEDPPVSGKIYNPSDEETQVVKDDKPKDEKPNED